MTAREADTTMPDPVTPAAVTLDAAKSDAMRNAPVEAPRRNLLRLYAIESRNEFLKQLRLPVYSVFTIVFPVMFYVLFAVVFGAQQAGSVVVATYMLATYGAFGIIGSALFGFGVGVATERGKGWMILKRASPMPPLAYFVAKIVVALAFGAVTVLVLFATGATLGGVSLPAATWASLFAVLLLGGLPFCAMGMAIGYLVGPNSAPVVVNLLYLPMSFLSGLWMPLEILPAAIQNLAPFLPAYHLGQLALSTIGAGAGGSPWVHLAALLGFTAVFLVAGVILYHRDEGRTFG